MALFAASNPSNSQFEAMSACETRRITLISPFSRYSGHHLEWTTILASQLINHGIQVRVICPGRGEEIRKRLPTVQLTEVNFGSSLLHKIFKLDVSRSRRIVTITQNLETLICAISAMFVSRSDSAIYWIDGRHYLMLLFVLLLSKQNHAHGIMGPIPYDLSRIPNFLSRLYRLAFKTNRLTFITETDAMTESWRPLAGDHVITIPVAIKDIPPSPSILTRNTLGISHDDFVCLLFGTHRGDKDYRTVIAAAKTSRTQPILLFAGPLISDNDPERILAEEGYARGICITRYLSNNEVSDVFSICDCVILPYPKGYEKGSGVLLQACEHNRPVIASDSGHLARFISEHRTGTCYEPQNATDLSQVIDRMFFFHRESNGTWDSNIEAVKRKFSWQEILPHYLKALRITTT
jgi:glycosyltransferase involved in cell wall biosynthesis